MNAALIYKALKCVLADMRKEGCWYRSVAGFQRFSLNSQVFTYGRVSMLSCRLSESFLFSLNPNRREDVAVKFDHCRPLISVRLEG
jgi:hypothetical protein